METSEYAVLIPNWNGKELVDRCLGSVVAAARRFDPAMPVVVIDDASKDGAPDAIAARFDSVALRRLPENVGFALAVNFGMSVVDKPWIFLLNNDLAVPGDFFERLAATRAHLNDPDLFAIGAQTVQWGSREPNHAGMNLQWDGRMLTQAPFPAETLTPCDAIQAGACLVDREKFSALGGFREIYRPGYWEDYDLAWRAGQRGWNNYYEPRVEAQHWGKRSMAAAAGNGGVDLLMKRNQLLFNWANLREPGRLARHLIWGLPCLLMGARSARVKPDEASWLKAWLAALAKLPAALRLRRGGESENEKRTTDN